MLNWPMSDELSPKETEPRREAALKTPPAKPFTPKTKPVASPGRPATKAQIAGQKRVDKTVIKRMRKR